MSNAVSALNGVTWSGGIATVTEMPLQGMITVRGPVADVEFREVIERVAAVGLPMQGHANCEEDRGMCWMSPDELMVLCSYEHVAVSLDKLQGGLNGLHSLCVDVSDARTMFELSGPHARAVLAKLVPVDLAPTQFVAGMFRRTRMAQVPVAFWLHEKERFRILCFRSHAQYVYDLLNVASANGSTVDYF